MYRAGSIGPSVMTGGVVAAGAGAPAMGIALLVLGAVLAAFVLWRVLYRRRRSPSVDR